MKWTYPNLPRELERESKVLSQNYLPDFYNKKNIDGCYETFYYSLFNYAH